MNPKGFYLFPELSRGWGCETNELWGVLTLGRQKLCGGSLHSIIAADHWVNNTKTSV